MELLVSILAPMATPLAVLLVGLLALNRLQQDVRPLVVNIISGVAKNAGSNAVAYAIALGFGLGASLSAFIDVFAVMSSDKIAALSWHQYCTLWAKVLNPFVVTVLAYATQNKFRGGGIGGTGNTNPPFPPSSP